MKKKDFFGVLKKYGGILILALVLIAQVASLVYVGTHKAGLHIDENYSYILSNSYDAECIMNATDLWNTWLDGDAFKELLSVERGEQFAYISVYKNNAQDAHPPLYYFLLHTLCSFFPGSFSPWIGIIMNIIITVLTQIVLYKLSHEITGSSLWSAVPVVLYGSMRAFIDTTVFIRMYALMTLFTVLLLWQHYRLITRECKYKPIIWCGVLTFLGTFTHYYFAIFAFFLAAATCVFLLARKAWKHLGLYAGAMLSGVILVFLVYPAGISQILGSETNNVGNEVASNMFDFSEWGPAISTMGKSLFKYMFIEAKSWHPVVIALILISALALVILRFAKKRVADSEEKSNDKSKRTLLATAILALLVVLAFLTISHTSGEFLNIRYLYNLYPVIALIVGIIGWLLAGFLKFDKRVLAFALIAVCLINTATIAKADMCSYLFTSRTEKNSKIIQACEDRPLMFINTGVNHQGTASMDIILECDRVYMGNYNEMGPMDEALSEVDCSGGIVYIVLTDKYWSDGFDGNVLMDEIIAESEILDSYEKFGTSEFSTVYIAYPQK